MTGISNVIDEYGCVWFYDSFALGTFNVEKNRFVFHICTSTYKKARTIKNMVATVHFIAPSKTSKTNFCQSTILAKLHLWKNISTIVVISNPHQALLDKVICQNKKILTMSVFDVIGQNSSTTMVFHSLSVSHSVSLSRSMSPPLSLYLSLSLPLSVNSIKNEWN